MPTNTELQSCDAANQTKVAGAGIARLRIPEHPRQWRVYSERSDAVPERASVLRPGRAVHHDAATTISKEAQRAACRPSPSHSRRRAMADEAELKVRALSMRRRQQAAVD